MAWFYEQFLLAWVPSGVYKQNMMSLLFILIDDFIASQYVFQQKKYLCLIAFFNVLKLEMDPFDSSNQQKCL